jgi:Flp pilus assembly protein protease CpaA
VILFLLIAAFIEAYWSSSAVTTATKYIVGTLLWLLVLGYLLFAGRGQHAPE